MKSCYWNIRKWGFTLRTQKCKWTELAPPHGANASFSAVEVKGMQPGAMNFSEGTTSIYIFILRKERCAGDKAPVDGISVK